MLYLTQDFQIELPEITQDRSVNVLSLVEPERGIPYQFIISRDQLLGSETLRECFERQVGVMGRQAQGLKTHSTRELELGPAKLQGFVLGSTFTQSGKTFHQLQALFVACAPQVTVLTLSSHVPITDSHQRIFQAALDSVVLTAPPPG